MANASNGSQQSMSCPQPCPEKQDGSAACQDPAPALSILTTHDKHFHPEWIKRTTLLPGWLAGFRRANNSYWRSLLWSWRLFRESRHFDAVVTGAEHMAQMFALMQSLFRTKSSRRVHVMIDFPWATSPSPQVLFLKRMQMKIAIQSIDQIFALGSPEEAERFADALGVSREKFRFVPFHYWPNNPDLPIPRRLRFCRRRVQGLSNPASSGCRDLVSHRHLHPGDQLFSRYGDSLERGGLGGHSSPVR